MLIKAALLPPMNSYHALPMDNDAYVAMCALAALAACVIIGGIVNMR